MAVNIGDLILLTVVAESPQGTFCNCLRIIVSKKAFASTCASKMFAVLSVNGVNKER